MKLTARAEYGTRCILAVARESDGRGRTADVSAAPALTVGEIAEREGLSLEYAGKLIRILRRAGLVDSALGRRGGYRLARPAEEISVREVLDALGARLYWREFCKRFAGARASCVHDSDCALRSLWGGLQLLIDDVLSRVTLRELIGTEQDMAERIRDHASTVEFVRLPTEKDRRRRK